MVDVITLDVSELAPPQPMHEICRVLVDLTPGQVLYVTHRRKPAPLFEMLEAKFDYHHEERAEGEHHIWLWCREDDQAKAYVGELCQCA